MKDLKFGFICQNCETSNIIDMHTSDLYDDKFTVELKLSIKTKEKDKSYIEFKCKKCQKSFILFLKNLLEDKNDIH